MYIEEHGIEGIEADPIARYYSAVDAQTSNGSVKLDCAWIGSQGYKRGYSTGIRIHFPQFSEGFRGNGNNDQ